MVLIHRANVLKNSKDEVIVKIAKKKIKFKFNPEIQCT